MKDIFTTKNSKDSTMLDILPQKRGTLYQKKFKA